MKQNTLKTKPAPAYLTRMNTDKANELYLKIVSWLTKDKLYRDPSYNTAKLAADLHTNIRYIAAAVGVCTGGNYNKLVNGLRLRDVEKMMRSAQYKDLNVEEIGLLAGFSSRQAFYLAFHREYECTPRQYRLMLEKGMNTAEIKAQEKHNEQ